jgi:hypothetical protein
MFRNIFHESHETKMLTTRETPTPNFTTNLFSDSLTYAFTWILMLGVNEVCYLIAVKNTE